MNGQMRRDSIEPKSRRKSTRPTVRPGHRERIWLIYDLGIRGDYEGLYAWLASKNATECGDNAATLHFEYRTDLIKEITSELKKNFEMVRKARIYVVYLKHGKIAGRFLSGGRKSPPWADYAFQKDDIEDSD